MKIPLVLTPLFLCLSLMNISAQTTAFEYDPEKVETGVVYQYVKSNIDGTNAGNISIYVAEKDRLESLKWHPGDSTATLVVAEMDWDRFTVGRFDSYQLRRNLPTLRRAILESTENSRELVATFRNRELHVRIDNWPWHSYDFDLASLNFAWRHLVDPEKPFTVGITDAVQEDDEIKLADKGEVKIIYKRDTQRNGHDCREYSIDGPGLENQGGTIWIRKTDGVLVEYEIELPDEEGFKNGKLKLVGVVRMTPEKWEEYKTSRVARVDE